MGFKPSKADPDMWYRDKHDHYEYIATYVDDLLVVSRDPQSVMKALEEQYVLKGVGIPENYLGADIIQAPEEWKTEPVDWIISSKTYTSTMIQKFEELMSMEAQNMHSQSTKHRWTRNTIQSWMKPLC